MRDPSLASYTQACTYRAPLSFGSGATSADKGLENGVKCLSYGHV